MKIMILLSIDLHSTKKLSPWCIESMFLASNNCYWPGNMLIEYDRPCQLNRLAFATTECHDISVEFGKLQYVCYFLRIQIDGKTKYHSSCVYCRYCTAAFLPSGACLARQKKESHWCNVGSTGSSGKPISRKQIQMCTLHLLSMYMYAWLCNTVDLLAHHWGKWAAGRFVIL